MDAEVAERVAGGVEHLEVVDPRLRQVAVGREVAAQERVDEHAAVDLGQVDVPGRRLDVAEDGHVRDDVLVVDDRRVDVLVLEADVVRAGDDDLVRVMSSATPETTE